MFESCSLESMYHQLNIPKSYNKLGICFIVENNIFEKRSYAHRGEKNVGYMSSLLQKCFRNGASGNVLLVETIRNLNKSPGYNLPDYHFVRVSGARQLLWRSYISIIEDISGYQTSDKYLDLLDIYGLAYVCQLDPSLNLNKNVLKILENTLLKVQNIGNVWNWKSGNNISDELSIENLVKKSKKFKNGDRLQQSFILANLLMPMMSGDRNMLIRSHNLISQNIVLPNLDDLANNHNENYNIDSEIEFGNKNEGLRYALLSVDINIFTRINTIYSNKIRNIE